MNNAYYFSHDTNARNDPKILMLRAEFGWEGYGIYFALLEMMFDSDETALKLKCIKAIALANNMDYKNLMSLIDMCVEEGLFEKDDEHFWSRGLRKRKEVFVAMKEQRSEAGKLGMAKRWGTKPVDNGVITSLQQSNNDDITKNNKGKESKGKDISITLLTEIIGLLNTKADTTFKPTTESTRKHIHARLAEGYTIEDFKKVITHKCNEWKNDPKYCVYLRPETLFGTKFESYLNAASVNGKNHKDEIPFGN